MKLLIITGGSRGLGKSICALAKNHWNILDLSRSGTSENSIYCDLEQIPQGLELARQKITELQSVQFDEIRVILNAATIAPIGLAKNLSDPEIQRAINMISGTIALASTILSAFANHSCRKSLVQISSGAAVHGRSGWTIYCLSKAGMENWIRALAEEQLLEPFPFETAIFDPGVMDSEMQEEIRASSPTAFPSVNRFIELKSTGKLRQPELVASALWKRMDQPLSVVQRIGIE